MLQPMKKLKLQPHMQWHKFIFSEKRSKRLQRHVAFWLAWLLYLSFCEYLYQLPLTKFKLKPFYVNVGPQFFLKTFLSSGIHIYKK